MSALLKLRIAPQDDLETNHFSISPGSAARYTRLGSGAGTNAGVAEWPQLPPGDSPSSLRNYVHELPSYNPLSAVSSQATTPRAGTPTSAASPSSEGGDSNESGGTRESKLPGDWPTVSAMIIDASANGGARVTIEELPPRLSQAVLLAEKRLKLRIRQLAFKDATFSSTKQWQQVVRAFWADAGRRGKARLAAVLRTVATGLRKRREDRCRQAAHQLWELVQRGDICNEAIDAAGLGNVVALLNRTEVCTLHHPWSSVVTPLTPHAWWQDADTIYALLSALGTYAIFTSNITEFGSAGVIDAVANLRRRLTQLAQPRLQLAVGTLCCLVATTVRGRRALCKNLNATLPALVQLLRASTMQVRAYVPKHACRLRPVASMKNTLWHGRLGVNLLYAMLQSSRHAVAGLWARKWGWYPVLNIVSQSPSLDELLVSAAIFVEVARSEELLPLISDAVAVQILCRQLEYTMQYLSGAKRAPYSHHRERVKDLQRHVAAVMWAVTSNKDPGVAHLTTELRVTAVLSFLNSPRHAVATAGAALVSVFGTNPKFASGFVAAGGVTTLLRRARNATEV